MARLTIKIPWIEKRCLVCRKIFFTYEEEYVIDSDNWHRKHGTRFDKKLCKECNDSVLRDSIAWKKRYAHFIRRYRR